MKNLEKFWGTQKQWFCVVVIALVCAGTAFTQQRQPAQAQAAPPTQAQAAPPQASGDKKNAVSFWDTMPLVKGFLMSDEDAAMFFFYLAPSYERLIAPHFSIGPELDFCFGKVGEEADGDDIPYFYFSMSLASRYYPMSQKLEKFYVGANLGFNVQAIDGKTKPEKGGFVGPLIGLEAGYKLLFKNVFFLEPSMAFVYSKSPDWALGWQGGLRIGVEF